MIITTFKQIPMFLKIIILQLFPLYKKKTITKLEVNQKSFLPIKMFQLLNTVKKDPFRDLKLRILRLIERTAYTNVPNVQRLLRKQATWRTTWGSIKGWDHIGVKFVSSVLLKVVSYTSTTLLKSTLILKCNMMAFLRSKLK